MMYELCRPKKIRKVICKALGNNKYVNSEQIGPPTDWVSSTIHWTENFPYASCSIIREPCQVTRKAPTCIGGGAHKEFKTDAKTAPVFLAEIPEGRIWKEGCEVAVITPDDRLLKDLSKVWGSPPSSHNVFESLSLGDVRDVKGRCLLLATTSGNGYFHWMMDVIPRVKIANEKYNLESFDKIITNKIKEDYQYETLKMSNIDMEKVIQISDGKQIKCEKLIAPSLPRENARTQRWAVRYVKNMIKKSNKKEGKEKIYLSREDAKRRRVKNEKEVVKLLSAYGFDKVKMSEHSVREQAKIISESKYIVAPHGANIANILFCEKCKNILEMFPKNIVPCYWQIASIKGINYSYIYSEKCDKKSEDFVADTGKIKEWIQKIG